MAIRCAKCGTVNPDRAASCKSCGKAFYFPRMDSNRPPVKIATRKCSSCGAPAQYDADYCPECGAKYPTRGKREAPSLLHQE